MFQQTCFKLWYRALVFKLCYGTQVPFWNYLFLEWKARAVCCHKGEGWPSGCWRSLGKIDLSCEAGELWSVTITACAVPGMPVRFLSWLLPLCEQELGWIQLSQRTRLFPRAGVWYKCLLFLHLEPSLAANTPQSGPCVWCLISSPWLPIELRSKLGLRPALSCGLKTDWC